MSKFEKFGLVEKGMAFSPDMEKIHRQTLVELTAEDVFTFRLAACNDQPDREHERFTLETLEGLAPMYVGKPVILDHEWSAKGQSARVYDAYVEEAEGANHLVLCCYTLKNDYNAQLIQAIEGGILREVSVGCAIEQAICSVCGADLTKIWCEHVPGREYEGETCVVELTGAADAYEVSFCAVPCQPGAGVRKSYGGEAKQPEERPAEKTMDQAARELELLELENKSIS